MAGSTDQVEVSRAVFVPVAIKVHGGGPPLQFNRQLPKQFPTFAAGNGRRSAPLEFGAGLGPNGTYPYCTSPSGAGGLPHKSQFAATVSPAALRKIRNRHPRIALSY